VIDLVAPGDLSSVPGRSTGSFGSGRGSRAGLAALAMLGGCGAGGDGGPSPFGDATGTGAEEPASGDGGSTTAAPGADGTDDAPDSADDGIKFDLDDTVDLGRPGCATPDGACGCSFVDLLFVIDNSESMAAYQSALALAFPQFAETLTQVLPPGTNVHVGVTSTEMRSSPWGCDREGCTWAACVDQSCDQTVPIEEYYLTPEEMDTGRNGAQGRLFVPEGGPAYFEIDTGAGDLGPLEEWFSRAAKIGTGGSNLEMASAPIGWVASPANAATNAGFLRDAGAVTVVFVMQDEPDQTPSVLDDKPAGIAMLDRLAAAKTECGGVDCIIGGGFIKQDWGWGCLFPVDDFMSALTHPPSIAPLPDVFLALGDPATAAQQMNAHLSDVLAGAIAQTCAEIPPAG